jgi:hypothetical protein
MAFLSSISVFFSIITLTLVLTAGCDSKKENIDMTKQNNISADEWKLLTQRKILFGHQSVGNDILKGMQALAKRDGVQLPINELINSALTPGILHFKIGKNDDPYSKIKDFEEILTTGAVKGTDIAMMKLCYIDIHSTTDVSRLANAYSECLDRLSQKFPGTVFIAVTTPLTTVQSGPKAWVKRAMGRKPSGYEENARRKEFNDYLRERFSKPDRLFDLARYENDGSGSFEYNKRPIEILNPINSDDGGHLNTQGQQYLATQLLKFLASVSIIKSR